MLRRGGSNANGAIDNEDLEIGTVLASMAGTWLNGHKRPVNERHSSCFYTEGIESATTAGDFTGEDD